MGEMKDSRIDWLGDIPGQWSVYRNKALFRSVSIRNHGDASVLSLYRELGIVPKDSRDDNHNVTSLDTDSYKYVVPGDLVINKMKAWSGSVAISDYEGIVSPAYYVCKVDYTKVVPRFIHHYLRNPGIVGAYEMYSAGMRIGQWDLGIDDFMKIKIALPSISVQESIAKRIDTDIVKIDALIANQEAQIEKLKQYKQSLITEVVTKGLDPDAPMKDSGIDSIRRINSSYRMLRLKQVARILDEYRKPITADMRNQDADELYDYYGASGVIDKIDGYTIDDHVMLIGEDGANLRLRNLPLMYEVDGKAWINNHAHILKPNEDVDFYYLFYALESIDLNPYITGSAQPKLSQENLKNIWLPVPDIEEQKSIVDYIREKHSGIDKLIEYKNSKLNKLKEYKKSIIYEYVTGKKEVV